MKTKLLLIFLLCPFLVLSQTENPEDLRDVVFTIVETPPKYQGGEKAFIKFLKKHSKFRVTKKSNSGFSVFISFIVTHTGKIEKLEFLKDVPSNCRSEVIRLFSLMPPWTPGRQRDIPVNVKLVRQVRFVFE